MSFSFRVTGSKKIKAKLAALTDEYEEEIEKELIKGAFRVQRTAKKSIQSSPADPVTGRSKPGNPPKTDTGRLVNSIYVNAEDGGVFVGTNVKYGKWLEFGTRYISPRPFLQPALEFHRKKIIGGLYKIVNKATKKAGR